ncbi:hypothetical protein STRAU_6546 [Streptomyces aurantiacus JA 4570]|uniref:Uncharacterized protein n=1 Tax=Streptomyces aurantiacus JA 4570 TaxID=1286094 RepID=S4AFY0_9ACTN|nr:hypothetical protein STRAU_6546 [Streptomyces aurantiacus JA 4570]
MQGDERGGAGGVDGDGGAFEAEGVGQTAGGDARRVAGHDVALDAFGAVEGGRVALGGEADEDAGLAGAQGRRHDARALERLPGGFQEEPLLRVHGQGLARVDAEELGVELVGVVEEGAGRDVRQALVAVRGGTVAVEARRGGDVPAPVHGEPGQAVRTGGHHAPQVFGRPYAAGVAAAHRDDGDGVVLPGRRIGGAPCGGRGGALRERAEEFRAQMSGEGDGGGVVEDQARREAQRRGGAEPVAEFDGGERVEAQLLERLGRVDGFGRRVAEDGGDVGAYEVDEELIALLLAEPRQALGQGLLAVGRRVARLRGGGAADLGADEGAEQRGHVGPELLPEGVRVQLHRDEGAVRLGQGGVQEGQALLRRQRALVEGSGHAALIRPQTPRQRRRGQPLRAAVLGQSVQEGVGSRVVGLTRTAQHTGRRGEQLGGRGEQHERRQIKAGRQLVQVDSRVHLRPQHRVQPLRRQRRHHTVVDHTRHMHHGGQISAHPVQDRLERITVGHITGRDGDTRAQLLQFRPHFPHTRSVLTPTRNKEQIPYAMMRGQMPGHDPPQPAQRAGDQHRAPAVEHRRQRQHHLAHMPGLTQITERLRRPPHIPRLHRERLQHPLLEQGQHLRQHLPNTVASGVDEVEAPVGDAGVLLGDGVRVAEVGLAHLHEAPAARQQPQRRVHELPRQRVQHDIDAPAFGPLKDRRLEVQVPGRRDTRVLNPQLP